MGESPTVAVLGMGRMGAAMVGTLRRAGFTVHVHNRTAAKAEQVATATGAVFHEAAPAAVAEAGVVISTVADDAAVVDLFIGRGRALDGLQAGTVVVEMSTIKPQTVRALAADVEGAGAALVDAPVSGSVPLVEKGALTVMAGGPAESVETVRPVLEALAGQIFHVGESGAGATMKLAVNAIVHNTNVAISEALVLAERAGLDRESVYEVFAGSAVASPFLAYKQPRFEHPDPEAVDFSLDLVGKDLALISSLAAEVAADVRQLDAAAEVVADAIDQGYGPWDMSAVAEYLRNRR